MKVRDINIFPVYIPFKDVWESNWNKRSGALSFVIEIIDEDGVCGFGDCMCKQSPAAGLEILRWAAGLLKGRSIYQVEEFRLLFEGLGRWTWKHDLSFVGHPLLSGFEMALWDLIGKKHGRPIYDIWGGKVNDKIDLTVQIPTGPAERLEREADRIRRAGFGTIFMKLAKANKSVEEDVDSVRRAREVLGPGVRITLDVNGAWSVPTAVRALRMLEKYDITYVESPVIGVENLAILRKRVGIPIAADEESCSYRKLMQLIRSDAVDVVVLDLPSFGGLGGLKKAVDLLELANIPAVLHANGEILASYAAFQCAAAHQGFKFFAHQFYHELGESFVNEFVPGSYTPEYTFGNLPGLGITIDRTKLKGLSLAYASVTQDVEVSLLSEMIRVPSFPKY